MGNHRGKFWMRKYIEFIVTFPSWYQCRIKRHLNQRRRQALLVGLTQPCVYDRTHKRFKKSHSNQRSMKVIFPYRVLTLNRSVYFKLGKANFWIKVKKMWDTGNMKRPVRDKVTGDIIFECFKARRLAVTMVSSTLNLSVRSPTTGHSESSGNSGHFPKMYRRHEC